MLIVHSSAKTVPAVRRRRWWLPVIFASLSVALALILFFVRNRVDDGLEHAASSTAANWQVFRSEVGKYSVLLPNQPQVWKVAEKHPQLGYVGGETVVALSVEGDWESIAGYTVNYFEYSAEVTIQQLQSELDRLQDSFEEDAELISKSDFALGSLGGVELVLKTSHGYDVIRCFLTPRGRLYVLMVTSTRDPATTREQIDRFFDSFKLARSD